MFIKILVKHLNFKKIIYECVEIDSLAKFRVLGKARGIEHGILTLSTGSMRKSLKRYHCWCVTP